MHHQHAVSKFGTVRHKQPMQHIRLIMLQPGIEFGLEIQMIVVRKQFNFHALSPLQIN
jgi:hypothetical protein